tara:strand:+ start:5035 stop:5499 length:465 start_codon:yes stop_codon:yes gene_type:complete
MGRQLIEIEGFEKLQKSIERAAETGQARRLLIPVLKSAARPTLAAAKQLAPVGTRIRSRTSGGKKVATYYPGNLRKSLGILTVKDKANASIIVAIRSGSRRKYDGYYGHMVEHGTVNSPAQPFMGPAFNKTKGMVSKKAERGTLKVIQRQLNKI